MRQADNAVILAAGTSSRFAPLSYEKHKAMTIVSGEILIERQIKQLMEAGVPEVFIVTGYKAEQFEYLVKKYGIRLIYNPDYRTRNNNASIWYARKILGNSYICSADNYFSENPFDEPGKDAYYSAVYTEGSTAEWCMTEDAEGYINSVTIGGEKSWFMLGHAYWNRSFTEKFLGILEEEYRMDATAEKLWEKIDMEHLDILKMKIKRYRKGVIHEFDTLDELREFDASYITDTRSLIIQKVAKELRVEEKDIIRLRGIKGCDAEAVGFEFDCPKGHFIYTYKTGSIIRA